MPSIVNASSVVEDKIRPKEITIINVYHNYPGGKCKPHEDGGICTVRDHWRIGVRGNDYDTTTIGALIKSEASEGRGGKVEPGAVSERTVMIRADQGALYEYVQKVIEACAMSGLYKIEIGAAAKV